MSTLQFYAELLHRYTLPAMVLVFVLTALFLYWPGRKDEVERPGMIPFEEDR